MVFSSTQGFSQISVSQVSASLTVTYSADCQTDREQRHEYLNERTTLIFNALEGSGHITPLSTGLSTLVHLPLEIEDRALISLLHNYITGKPTDELFDISFKRVYVIDAMFFHNVVIESFRTWKTKRLDDR
jgi:hypothetical protein